MVYAYLILPTGSGVDQTASQAPSLLRSLLSNEPGMPGRSQSHKGLNVI